MSIKLGVHSGQQDCSYDELRKIWHLADTSGLYWVSVWDHFYEAPYRDGTGDCFEATATMAALAAETRNVRVGCLVFCMGYRNPGVLAKSAATIDHISGGRLELGIGGGWHEAEHQAFGIPFRPVKERLDILEESVQIIRSLLTNEKTSFNGHYFKFEDAYCNPKPLQPSPRIWIGGRGEIRTLRIVAKYADGWNAAYISAEDYQKKSEILDQWCAREDRDPKSIQRNVNVHFQMGANEISAQQKRKAFQGQEALYGTPAEVIEHIGEYAKAGAEGLNIALRAPFDWEALQAFMEEVVPHFK